MPPQIVAASSGCTGAAYVLVIVAVAVLLLISRNSMSAGLVDALETPITLVVAMANVVVQ